MNMQEQLMSISKEIMALKGDIDGEQTHPCTHRPRPPPRSLAPASA